ncbi:MAG: hypothetical protein L6R39_004840, partial [Caloplaca ligustica]
MSTKTDSPADPLPEEKQTKPQQNNEWTEAFFKQGDTARRYKNAEIATGPFAKVLVEEAGLLDPLPPDQKLTILDNACGIGAVAAALHEMLDPETVRERMELTCGDFAEPMLKAVGERIEENGWVNTKVKLVDAQNTGLPDASFSHVLANFVIMGLQDPDAALN